MQTVLNEAHIKLQLDGYQTKVQLMLSEKATNQLNLLSKKKLAKMQLSVYLKRPIFIATLLALLDILGKMSHLFQSNLLNLHENSKSFKRSSFPRRSHDT